MEVKRISPFLSVSPQIYPAHVERLAAQGFKTIINNRPDNETDDQPLGEELAAEAAKHDMEFINIPVISGELTELDVKEFGEAMQRVTGPQLAKGIPRRGAGAWRPVRSAGTGRRSRSAGSSRQRGQCI